MSFVTKSRRFTSVKSQLTVASTAALTLMALSAFAVLYFTLRETLARRIDEALTVELGEFQDIFRDGGLEALKKEIHFEQNAIGRRGGYMRIYHESGKRIDSGDLSEWGQAAAVVRPVSSLTLNMPVFDTVQGTVNEVHVRRLHGLVAPGTAVLMAYSLDQNYELLTVIRNRFSVALITMVALALIVSWFIARRAMRGVDAVTAVAEKVASGTLDLRVNAEGGGWEVERLADSFNMMLDRIADLIREIKETNDNIAHDLRSPMTRIRSMAESLISHAQDPERTSELAGEVLGECDNLLNLTNTMLDIAEMEAGVASLQVSEVNLTDLLRDVCDLFLPVAEKRGIPIELKAGALIVIHADKARLLRALSNVVDNALKYSPDGGSISVAVQKLSGSVEVEIADSGCGIEDADLPHIFDRFFRGDKNRTSSGNGLGLGVVKAIVSAHHGTVTASNNAGRGTTFRIRLPIEARG